ncbi:hypothetical protein B0O80DRAFT_98018 [Mortierella sp. GBAus27b]|nr:hypothetical protein B0O80DRAFT_98018 [Mortierella sp. GBAus27b]
MSSYQTRRTCSTAGCSFLFFSLHQPSTSSTSSTSTSSTSSTSASSTSTTSSQPFSSSLVLPVCPSPPPVRRRHIDGIPINATDRILTTEQTNPIARSIQLPQKSPDNLPTSMSGSRHSNSNSYRSDYAPLNQRSSPSPPPSSPPPTSWTSGSFIRRDRRHDEILDRNPRPSNPTAYPAPPCRELHTSTHSDGLYSTHSYRGSRTRYPPVAFKSAPHDAPRSNIKALTTIDRIKTDLKAPDAPLSPRHSYPLDYHPSPSPQPMHLAPRFEDGPVQRVPTPTLHGVKCTEINQKAYSGQSSQMKESFDTLQRLDCGKVEDRTIGKHKVSFSSKDTAREKGKTSKRKRTTRATQPHHHEEQ